MKLFLEDRERDTDEVVELSISYRDLGPDIRTVKTLQKDAARSTAETLFSGEALDMKSTFVSGMITAQIQMTFEGGAEVKLDVYNDRLAVDRTSETGYYLSTAFAGLRKTL